MSKIHASKVRYCSASEPKDDQSLLNIEWNGQSVEATGASASTKYFGMGIKSGGGGPFFVYPHNTPKRFGSTKFAFHGHTGKVTDSDFHPFNEDIVATGSLDATVKIWRIPEGGVLTQHVKSPLLSLEGHSKRILFTEFHPSANSILASASSTTQNEVKVWDITKGEAVCEFAQEVHTALITDMKWGPSGAVLATACRDKMVRTFNPRARDSVTAFKAFTSIRPMKVCWIDDAKMMVTGFGKTGKREVKIFDMRKTESALSKSRVDSGSNSLYPVYDRGTNIVLLLSKGATSIGVWEYIPSEDSITHCSQSSFKEQCRGFAVVPKRACDILDIEIARIMWMAPKKVQAMKFKIPRKTTGRFIKEFFPDDLCGEYSMESSEWLAGANKPPILKTMNPKKFSAKKSTMKKFVVPKTRAELESELKSALAEIAKIEAVKKALLEKMKAAGIEPKALDPSALPPAPPEPEPEPVAATKVVEPVAPVVSKPEPVKETSKPAPTFEKDPLKQSRPVRVKKKKKKGPLLTVSSKKKQEKKETDETSNAVVASDAPGASEGTEKKSADDDYVKVENDGAKPKAEDLIAAIASKLGKLDIGTLEKILAQCDA